MQCRRKCLLINFRNWFPTFSETFYVVMWFLRFCCLFLDFAYRFLLLIDNKKSVFRQFWEWMWKVHEMHSFHHEIRKIYHTIQFQWFCNERNTLRTRLSDKLVIAVFLLLNPIWKWALTYLILQDFFCSKSVQHITYGTYRTSGKYRHENFTNLHYD